MDLLETVGIIGAILYVVSYGALQFGLLNSTSYTYTLLNMFGAGFVLISLMGAFNLSSAIIQVTWITISIVGLVRVYLMTRGLTFTPEELDFANKAMPGLPKTEVRRFLNQGFWIQADQGTELTREGEPVTNLVYLHSGGAVVEVGGRQVAEVSQDSFIGEITCMTGEPASGTVIVNQPSHYFCFNAEKLRQFLVRNIHISAELDRSFASHLKRKLIAQNQTIASNPKPVNNAA